MVDKEKEIQRGHRAKQILEDEIFIESVNKIRTELISDETSSEQRENIFRMRRMLEVVLMQLQSVLETGKLATQEKQSQ